MHRAFTHVFTRLFFSVLAGMLVLTLSGCTDDAESRRIEAAKAAKAAQKARAAEFANNTPLRVGIFPRRNLATTRKAFRPLIDHLSKELNTRVILSVPLNFKRFWQDFKSGRYDIVHYNQYHYVISRKEDNYRVLVTNEEMGNSDIAGALFVRKDSGVNTVEDLRGKRIMFGGGRKAMGSYIAPLSVLKQHGLDKGDFEEIFAKNPPAALINVHRGTFEAAGTGDVVLDLKVVRSKINADAMKMLASSDRYVHLPWAVNPNMDEKLSSRIQKIMVDLKSTEKGKSILKSARVTGFKPAVDKDFDKVREIVKFALDEVY